MEDQDEFSEVDDELLEDFESELASEERARKKKRALVVAGVLAGGALALFLTYGGGVDNEATVAPVKPAQETTKTAEPALANNPAPDQPANIDEQIASLQGENVINEDFSAPGKLMEVNPAQTTEAKAEPAQATPEQAIPEQATPEQATPEPAKTEKNVEPAVEKETSAENTVTRGKEDSEKPATSTEKVDTEQKAVEKAPEKKAVKHTPAPAPKQVKSAVTRPMAKPRADKTPYAVQVMATLNSLAALDMRDKLLKKGFDSWISIGKARQNVYRVEAGNFSNIKQAALLSARMAQAGFVTRTAYTDHGAKVTLIAGTYRDRQTAQKLKKSIASAGFTARIVHKTDSQSLYMVRVGKHKTRQEAALEIKALKNAGIPILGITR